MKIERMPCPACTTPVAANAFAMDRGPCPACSVELRRVVPLFAVTAPPYGWFWARADDPRWNKEKP